MTHRSQASISGYLTLSNLLSCATAAQLRVLWLELDEDQRRSLRPSRALAHHAWSLLIRDRILNGAAR
jgi:hypothetical protein